jgi:5-methylcytosine-specific restriction endonuclease McrBC regulatory subunit McrC
VIELIEYTNVTVELEPSEAIELARLSRGSGSGDKRPRVIERVAPAVTPGTYEVQPGPYVGRFRLGSGRVVDIGSRFPFQDLTVLLRLGRRATMLYEDASAAGAGHGLMDIIALALLREAERIAGQGLAKAYTRQTFLRPPYPGAPSATAHLREHAGRPDRLATHANRLTPDVDLNRLLATAHRRLMSLPYTDATIARRLRAIAPVFQNIADVNGRLPDIADVPARYRHALPLARLILDGRTTLPIGDGSDGASVLFPMTKIWEAYVGRWLSERSPGCAVSSQHRILLTDSGQERPAWADFVLQRGGAPIAVYDAKYRPWRSDPSTSEIYQLYTYARRLGVGRAALVYPAAEDHHATTSVDDVTIESYGVPVRQLNSGS